MKFGKDGEGKQGRTKAPASEGGRYNGKGIRRYDERVGG
jgi:hypothetical protein